MSVSRGKAGSDAVDTPAVCERLAAVGVTVIPPERRSPDHLAKYTPSDIEKWAAPIKAAGVTGE